MLEGSYQLGLSDLLDQNLSCYEYFNSLPENVQRRIVKRLSLIHICGAGGGAGAG